ncbi:MAG: hypothetical protein U0175_27290 [Caldilineaceae bacterium]
MDKSYDLQPLVDELLLVVPELVAGYKNMEVESQNAKQYWSKKDYEDLDSIAKMHGLPKSDYGKPGVTIVFEDLLVRFMLEIAEDKGQAQRLKPIMQWIEHLANHEEFAVRNLIAVSVCEPLITTHQDKLHLFVPLMGEKTKSLCTMQFEMYNLWDETKRLFGITP